MKMFYIDHPDANGMFVFISRENLLTFLHICKQILIILSRGLDGASFQLYWFTLSRQY